ncbi:conserved Plasmodium protein, unknown function [Plasmodium ovale]|uniref:Clp1 P-loop domain-containing protein n=2 Tax=Plasmodium ovale TaxID=36330 RepID=A0A1A8WDP0_PLAOA|nr:hypothetical protein, conserved [Plasmodium ovale curtisi]SBS90138.1 hypothetical protein, conserved [Plasmodium ovale curtisi]SCP04351.1 conserved Plasmodium protein, unknown function [Plasmodium ovale]
MEPLRMDEKCRHRFEYDMVKSFDTIRKFKRDKENVHEHTKDDKSEVCKREIYLLGLHYDEYIFVRGCFRFRLIKGLVKFNGCIMKPSKEYVNVRIPHFYPMFRLIALNNNRVTYANGKFIFCLDDSERGGNNVHEGGKLGEADKVGKVTNAWIDAFKEKINSNDGDANALGKRSCSPENWQRDSSAHQSEGLQESSDTILQNYLFGLNLLEEDNVKRKEFYEHVIHFGNEEVITNLSSSYMMNTIKSNVLLDKYPVIIAFEKKKDFLYYLYNLDCPKRINLSNDAINNSVCVDTYQMSYILKEFLLYMRNNGEYDMGNIVKKVEHVGERWEKLGSIPTGEESHRKVESWERFKKEMEGKICVYDDQDGERARMRCTLYSTIVIGDKGKGKSLLTINFINSLLNYYKTVLLLDIDIGQPIIGVSGFISLYKIKHPLNNYHFFEKKPKCIKKTFFGCCSIAENVHYFIRCLQHMYMYLFCVYLKGKERRKFCQRGRKKEGEDAKGEDAKGEYAKGEDAKGEDAKREDAKGEDVDEESARKEKRSHYRYPLIINSFGWVENIGLFLLNLNILLSKCNFIIQMDSIKMDRDLKRKLSRENFYSYMFNDFLLINQGKKKSAYTVLNLNNKNVSVIAKEHSIFNIVSKYGNLNENDFLFYDFSMSFQERERKAEEIKEYHPNLTISEYIAYINGENTCLPPWRNQRYEKYSFGKEHASIHPSSDYQNRGNYNDHCLGDRPNGMRERTECILQRNAHSTSRHRGPYCFRGGYNYGNDYTNRCHNGNDYTNRCHYGNDYTNRCHNGNDYTNRCHYGNDYTNRCHSGNDYTNRCHYGNDYTYNYQYDRVGGSAHQVRYTKSGKNVFRSIPNDGNRDSSSRHESPRNNFCYNAEGETFEQGGSYYVEEYKNGIPNERETKYVEKYDSFLNRINTFFETNCIRIINFVSYKKYLFYEKMKRKNIDLRQVHILPKILRSYRFFCHFFWKFKKFIFYLHSYSLLDLPCDFFGKYENCVMQHQIARCKQIETTHDGDVTITQGGDVKLDANEEHFNEDKGKEETEDRKECNTNERVNGHRDRTDNMNKSVVIKKEVDNDDNDDDAPEEISHEISNIQSRNTLNESKYREGKIITGDGTSKMYKALNNRQLFTCVVFYLQNVKLSNLLFNKMYPHIYDNEDFPASKYFFNNVICLCYDNVMRERNKPLDSGENKEKGSHNASHGCKYHIDHFKIDANFTRANFTIKKEILEKNNIQLVPLCEKFTHILTAYIRLIDDLRLIIYLPYSFDKFKLLKNVNTFVSGTYLTPYKINDIFKNYSSYLEVVSAKGKETIKMLKREQNLHMKVQEHPYE